MIKTEKTHKRDCTYCSACINTCKVGAITKEFDEYGFAYPSINKDLCVKCGMCEKVCKSTKEIKKQTILQALAIQSNNKKLLKKSSSGGMFAQLAHYYLENDGIVFGCCMQKVADKFEIKHMYIDNEKDLYKLQGSKYVQSDIGDTYKQAKVFLEEGKQVLFSGTPCQIAGLKIFLNKEYANLLCVDISCEGVPNQKFFNDYIKFLEEKFNYPIIDFKFRNKDNGAWNTARVVVAVVDGKPEKYIIPTSQSSYFSLFINCHILRESCYNCQYTGLNRISDITVADAWGIDLEYPELNKKFAIADGMSLVLLNTEKGEKIFNKIASNVTYNPIDIEKLKKYNHPLRHPSVLTDDREYYLELYKNKGYAALDDKFMLNYKIKKRTFIDKIKSNFNNKEKVDALLMTMYANPNYGSILATYSLYETLSSLGITSKVIHYDTKKGYCLDFYKKYCKFTDKLFFLSDLKDLNKSTSTFILGSDNLINYKTDSLTNIARNLFNFSNLNKKRIIISGSMGDWNGKCKKFYEHIYLNALFKRFDYISTRENHGQKVLQNAFNCNADWINDPIFYLEKEKYETLISNVKTDYSNNIMQYILYPTNDTNEIVKYFENKYNAQSVEFQGNSNALSYSGFEQDISVENWLSAIKNSKIIITDSFHCTAFALMFNKPVICVKNTHAPIRFLSLFEALNINIPIIENVQEINKYNFEYDKQKVNQNIANIRNFAREKIKNSINSPKQNILQQIFYSIVVFIFHSSNYIIKNLGNRFSIKITTQ